MTTTTPNATQYAYTAVVAGVGTLIVTRRPGAALLAAVAMPAAHWVARRLIGQPA